MKKLEIKIDPNAINWNKLNEIYLKDPRDYDDRLWMLEELGILNTIEKAGLFWAKFGSGVDVSPTGVTPNRFYFVRREDCQNYINAFYPNNLDYQPQEMACLR